MSLQVVKKLISPKANSKGGKGKKAENDNPESKNVQQNSGGKNTTKTTTRTTAQQRNISEEETNIVDEKEAQTIIGFCATCKQDVIDDKKVENGMIECGRCAQWVCRLCTGMTVEALATLSSSERFHWYYDECDLIAMAAVEASKKMEKKVTISPAEVQKAVLSRMSKAAEKFEACLVKQTKQLESEVRKSYAAAVKDEMLPQISSIQRELKNINT